MAAIDDFLRALRQQESSGNYSARNSDSGAYGAYQFMPETWRAWAQRAGLGPNAEMTPANQDRVARFKANELFQQYGRWEDVASIWYSGQPLSAAAGNASQGNYPTINKYVQEVMGRMGSGGGGGAGIGGNASMLNRKPMGPGSFGFEGAGDSGQPAGNPVNGRAPSWASAPITQGFGPTSEKLDSGYDGHANFNKGYDYGLEVGTAIDATVGGTVISAGDSGDGWGISVKVRDANGYTHNYGHLSSASVRPGQTVAPGQVVGASGNTGASTGPHLSYDVWDSDGRFVDPAQWVGGQAGGGQLGSRQQEYLSKYARYQALERELFGSDPTGAQPGLVPIVPTNDPRWNEYDTLEAELMFMEQEFSENGGGPTYDQYLDWFSYTDDPSKIDAENAANRYAREAEKNATAERESSALYDLNSRDNFAASEAQAAYRGSNSFSNGALFSASMKLPTKEELFQQSLTRLSANLPEVPDVRPRQMPLSPSQWNQAPAPPGSTQQSIAPPQVQGPPSSAAIDPPGTGPGGRMQGGTWAEGAGRSAGGGWGDPGVGLAVGFLEFD